MTASSCHSEGGRLRRPRNPPYASNREAPFGCAVSLGALKYTRRMGPWRALLCLGLITALAAACTPPPEPEGPRIETAEDLLAALRQAGGEIETTGKTAPERERERGR